MHPTEIGQLAQLGALDLCENDLTGASKKLTLLQFWYTSKPWLTKRPIKKYYRSTSNRAWALQCYEVALSRTTMTRTTTTTTMKLMMMMRRRTMMMMMMTMMMIMMMILIHRAHLLTHSFIHLLTHSLAHSLTHSLTPSFTHSPPAQIVRERLERCVVGQIGGVGLQLVVEAVVCRV